jgi:uncharacterized protein YegP (UPF0339 family)
VASRLLREGLLGGCRFEVYKDGKGEYRWRLRTGNGQVIATGGEGYATKANALGGIKACSETHRSRRL